MKLELEKTWDFPVIAESVETVGLKAEVRAEEYIEDFYNPRTNQCNLGVMVCSHRNYILGDEQVSGGIDFEVECSECDGHGYIDGLAEIPGGEDDCAACDGTGMRDVDPETYFKVTRGATVVLALDLYDHSGISMSCHKLGTNPGYPYNDRWDAGIVGFIFDTEETRAETGAPLDSIEKQLRAEVDEYDYYLRGECYYWRVFEVESDETIESCAGYLGDWGVNAAMEEAADSLTYERNKRIAEKRRETINRKWAAERDIVTVDA